MKLLADDQNTRSAYEAGLRSRGLDVGNPYSHWPMSAAFERGRLGLDFEPDEYDPRVEANEEFNAQWNQYLALPHRRLHDAFEEIERQIERNQ